MARWRTPLIVIGALLVLMGAAWFLQGLNVLPGSFMSGRREWSANGAVAMLVGAGLLVWAFRRPRDG